MVPPPPQSSEFGFDGQKKQQQQQGSLWSGHLNLGQLGTHATTLPDTSMPPPAPRSPWSHEPIVSSVSTGPTMTATPAPPPPTLDAASVNQHKRISRQLTINPYQHRPLPGGGREPAVSGGGGGGIPFPPPTGVPPPALHQHHLMQQQPPPP